MITLYHGSPFLFDKFDLSCAGVGTGIKFGYGIYLTEVEASAVHYSQPRNMPLMPEHYLYTVEIPDLTEDNHLTSAQPVASSIVTRVESRLGVAVPERVKAQGKEFRKWIGMTITRGRKAGLAEEKAAAELLDSVGVICNVWPTAQTKPDGPKNVAVFDASNIKIIKCEKIAPGNKHGVYAFIKEFYKQYDGIVTYPARECAVFGDTHAEWGVLSNMASTPIVMDGVTFKSAEHIFQMMKFSDPEYVVRVWNGLTAAGKRSGNIKMTAKSYEPEHRRPDWGRMVIDAMKFAQQMKYEQCEAFRNELERSKGLYIVEQQPNPKKRADAWSAKLENGLWTGPNLTGRLLMELRDNGRHRYSLPPDALEFVKIIADANTDNT